jgi:hypothetical protein
MNGCHALFIACIGLHFSTFAMQWAPQQALLVSFIVHARVQNNARAPELSVPRIKPTRRTCVVKSYETKHRNQPKAHKLDFKNKR